MDRERIVRIEAGVDSAAAGVYAAATALVLYLLNASNAYLAAGTAIAFTGCFYGLRSIEPEYLAFAQPAFDPRPFEPVTLDELMLTDLVGSGSAPDEPLVLDDILAEIGPDSRVVRLFDPAAMPPAGQPIDRIEQHLGEAGSQSAPPDASQALHEALAELRRSLR